MTNRQLTKVVDGNQILTASYSLIIDCVAYGACGVLLHPPKAYWNHHHWSSFLLPQVQQLCDQDAFQYVEVDQLALGHSANFTTGLTVLRLPELHSQLQGFSNTAKCSHKGPFARKSFEFRPSSAAICEIVAHAVVGKLTDAFNRDFGRVNTLPNIVCKYLTSQQGPPWPPVAS